MKDAGETVVVVAVPVVTPATSGRPDCAEVAVNVNGTPAACDAAGALAVITDVVVS